MKELILLYSYHKDYQSGSGSVSSKDTYVEMDLSTCDSGAKSIQFNSFPSPEELNNSTLDVYSLALLASLPPHWESHIDSDYGDAYYHGLPNSFLTHLADKSPVEIQGICKREP